MQRRTSLLLSLALLPCLASCTSGETGPPKEVVAPVSGTLTYQGQPLAYHAITFLPADGRRPAIAVTDEQGTFRMTTNEEGDGAPPGHNKVGVAFAGPPSDAPPGQEVPIDNPADMPKPKVKIPAKYHSPETSGLTVEVPEHGLTDYKLELE